MLPSAQLCVYAIFYARQRFHVSESEIRNYKVICALASSPNKDQPAVKIKGVHCTFKSLGDSFKPGGVMSNFVISIFIRHLFYKPCGHPGVSKKHYFFSNIGDNLLLHPDDASQAFSPDPYERHWFMFIVDIKDRMFVFLDSYYSKDDEYQEHVRDLLISHVQVNWD